MRKYNLLVALGEVIDEYSKFIKCNPEGRIVSFYRASEKNQNEFQLNLADGSCIVIYSDGTWAEYGPEIIPEDIAILGQPEPWPFNFLEGSQS
jgi:hypothetical protein